MTMYWLDCVAGNDTNGGTGPSDAWLTAAPLRALNGGTGPAGGSIIKQRGRLVAANDGTSYASLSMRLNSGTAAAKTTIRGYDPAYPAEWWCAGRMVNATGTLGSNSWARPDAGTYPDVWQVTLNTAWAGDRWCHYWNGNQGRAAADQPRRLRPVDSPELVNTTANSFFVDTTVTPTIRVNVAGLGATSPSGRILHGTRGYCLSGIWGTQHLWAGLSHVLFADWHYYACNHRTWALGSKPVQETGGGNIELRRAGVHFCEIQNDHSVIRPLGRAGPWQIDRSVIEGGQYGLLYAFSGPGLDASIRGVEGHCMTGWQITRNTFRECGRHGEGDGHAMGFLGSGKNLYASGNLIDGCVRPVVIWANPARTMPNAQNNLTFRRDNIINTHDSGSIAAQSGNASIGAIQTTSGSTEMLVTLDAAAKVGAGWSVTIATAETVGGVAVAATFLVSRRVSATAFYVRLASAASGTANSTLAHGITIAARGPDTIQAFAWESGQDINQDFSGVLIDGPVIDAPQLIPLSWSESAPGVPVLAASSSFRNGSSPSNAHALRVAALYDTPVVRHAVIRNWPIAAWTTNNDPMRFDWQRMVHIAPRKMGGTAYGFISAKRTSATYGITCDHNLFIAEASPPAGEVPQWIITGGTIYTTLAAWQGQDFPNGSGLSHLDLNSVLVTFSETLSPLTVDFGALSAAGVIVAEAAGDGVFSITAGNSSGYFAINSTTGEITLHASGVGNLSGSYVLTRHDDVANTNQQITITIIANAQTVDPSHPYVKTISAGSGNLTPPGSPTLIDIDYTLTPDRPVLIGHFVGDIQTMPWAVDPGAGVEWTFDPAPESRVVPLDGGGTGSRAVDGACINPWTWAGIGDKQPFDEREDLYYGTARQTSPVTLTAGDVLIMSKSNDYRLNGGTLAQAAPLLHSMCTLTMLAAVPNGAVYRPGLWAPAGTPLAHIDATTIPLLADPPSPKDWDGGTVAMNWDSVFTNPNIDNMQACPGMAWTLSCANTGKYSQETMVTCAIDLTSSSPSDRVGYRAHYVFGRNALLTRVRDRLSLTADEVQTKFDAVVQHMLDQYTWAAHEASIPTPGRIVRTATPIMAPFLARIAHAAGLTTMAADLLNLTQQDSPTISGNTHDPNQWKFVTSTLQELTIANRASATTFNGTYTLDDATDDTITFSESTDWNTLVNAPGSAAEPSRLVNWFRNVPFGITNGGAIGTKRFAIYELVGDTAEVPGYDPDAAPVWDRTGGTFRIYPPFSAYGLSPPTEIKFTAGQDDNIEWATDRGTQVVAYVENGDCDINGVNFKAGASPWGRYWSLYTGQWYCFALANVGLTSPAWSGNAEDLVVTKRIADNFKYFFDLGTAFFNVPGSIDQANTYLDDALQAMSRYYLLDDTGRPLFNFAVPSTLDSDYEPGLWGATATDLADNTATLSVETNRGAGTIYIGAWPSASTPNVAAVKAGTGATYHTTISPTLPGVYTAAASALSPGTSYKTHAVHTDNALDSIDSISSSWSTTGSSWAESVVSNNSGTAALYQQSGAPFTVTPTKIGVFAIRFRVSSTWPTSWNLFQARNSNGSIRFTLLFSSTGRLNFIIYNSTGTGIAQWWSASNAFAADTTYSLVVSWNTATSTLQAYINGSAVGSSTILSVTADEVPGPISRLAIVADTLGNLPAATIKLGTVIFDPALSAFIDLSTDIAKFYSGGNAVDPGDGTPIAGAQMAMVIDGNAAKWNNTTANNDGSVGGITKTAADFVDATWA